VHQAGQIGWPMTPQGESNLEVNVAVCDVIMALSPQQNSINDYVNQAVTSYPLDGTFLHHLTWGGQPLRIPEAMNYPQELAS